MKIAAIVLILAAIFANEVEAIIGGESASICQWPSVVALDQLCTGTLIHPHVIAFAAHCEFPNKVVFGEQADQPARIVGVKECKRYPGGGVQAGNDFAFCTLADAQPQSLVIPPLVTREVEWIQPGMPAVIVGFGRSSNSEYGTKRYGETNIRCLTPRGELIAGGAELDSCDGDSGGALFVRVGGAWRLAGVTSFGASCGSGGFYGRIDRALLWIEETTGLDLTPCHDRNGTWSPGPACLSWPAAPEVSHTDWSEECTSGSIPALDPGLSPDPVEIDNQAPRLYLQKNEIHLVANPIKIATTVRVGIKVSDSPGGCGLKQIRIEINGKPRPPTVLSSSSSEVAILLIPGDHQVTLQAEDWAGNLGEVSSVRIIVSNPL